MAYIIDLTLVMQIIFCLVEGKHPTSRRLIKAAVGAYLESNFKDDVRNQIADHVKQTKISKIVSSGGQDTTLEKIIEIIKSYRPLDPDAMAALTGGIPWPSASGKDDPW